MTQMIEWVRFPADRDALLTADTICDGDFYDSVRKHRNVVIKQLVDEQGQLDGAAVYSLDRDCLHVLRILADSLADYDTLFEYLQRTLASYNNRDRLLINVYETDDSQEDLALFVLLRSKGGLCGVRQTDQYGAFYTFEFRLAEYGAATRPGRRLQPR